MPVFAADSNRFVLASHGLTLPVTYSFKCYGTVFDVVVARNSGGGARIILRGVMDFENSPSPATAVAATAVIVIAGKPFVDLISTVRQAKRMGTLESTGKRTP